MNTGELGLELIEHFEGLKLKAYKDSVGIWTIGVGTIIYPNGIKVKEGDTCTKEQAFEYLQHDLTQKETAVSKLVKVPLSQNQFDSLVSFAYNLGEGSLGKSTLLKKVNKNPKDVTVKDEFLKWSKANGVTLAGLLRRRRSEAHLWLHGELNFYENIA